MNKNSLIVKLGRALLSVFLGAAASSALALPSVGTLLDNYCAQQPLQTSAPQQSRPFQASGSSCLLCHTSANASLNNLNTLGTATRSCTSSGCPSTVNSACVAHAPSGASITAPAVGTTVAQGQSLTFTAGNATNPDGFPLAYTWLFTGGMPNVSGQSVSVPMTVAVAGTITSTLRVINSVGMLATGTPPTRSVTVTGATLPALTASPSSLAFTAQAGGSSPAAQTVSVTSSGSAVNVAANAATSSGGNWLAVSPASAATPSTFNVSANTASLAAGTYSGTVTFSGTASNSPQSVTVTLTVTSAGNPSFTATIVAPAINVSVLPGGTVKFSGSGSGSSNLPLRYKWRFPGGSPTSSTRQNPGLVAYGSAGSYTATLTVTDSKGVVSTPATRVITVAPANQTPRVPSNDCLNLGEDGSSLPASTPTPTDD